MQYAYFFVFLLSLSLLPIYFIVKKGKKDPWMLTLFICVPTVNLGYFLISVSKTVEGALLANKIAYLGQVFVPLCMLMIISGLCGFVRKRWTEGVLIGAAVLMLAIVLTTGHLDWYYKSASIIKVSGATVLIKEYGPLHPINLIYVLFYFVSMITVVASSLKKKLAASQKHAIFVLVIVIWNIAIWIFEKLISTSFELLSIFYVLSSLAFLAVWMMLEDYVRKTDISQGVSDMSDESILITAMPIEVKLEKILSRLSGKEPLALREREILELILHNKKRKEIAAELNLSENTVKTYTRTLYSKLGVGSREDLYALLLEKQS